MAVSQRTRRPSRERRSVHSKLTAHQAQLLDKAIPLGEIPEAEPSEVMQLIINRVTWLLRAAAAEADNLKPGLAKNQSKSEMQHERWVSYDAEGNVVVMANYWVEREKVLREELAKLTEKAQALGLSERRTRVKEAEMQLLGEALKAAAQAAGLKPAQQRALGAALRTELATIEGTATEVMSA